MRPTIPAPIIITFKGWLDMLLVSVDPRLKAGCVVLQCWKFRLLYPLQLYNKSSRQQPHPCSTFRRVDVFLNMVVDEDGRLDCEY